MPQLLQWMKSRIRKSRELDRQAEKHFEKFSRFIWPWTERKLIFFVCCVAALDYASTYAVLELSGKSYLNEAGTLASWALEKGGFGGLFLVDLLAVLAISSAALILRFIFAKKGLKGLSRASFVFLLVPYAIMAIVAVFNNLILAFI